MAENDTAGALKQPEPSVTTVDPEEYQHLLEDYSHLAPPSRHEVLEGRVLKISGSDVFIDVGYKSDGVAPLAQFTDAERQRHRSCRRSCRGDGRERPYFGRLRGPVPRKSGAPQDLGQPRKRASAAAHHLRPGARPRQGRSFGRRRRACVHARFAGGRAARCATSNSSPGRTSRSRS